MRPDEGVLGHLLGVVRVAEDAQRDRVAAVDVRADEGLERPVEVAREAFGEFAVVHQVPEPGAGGSGCIRRPIAILAPPRGHPGADAACHNPAMRIDDRFDDLVASLGGFYRTWYVFVGLELGLLQRLRDAGAEGLTPAELAQRTGTEPRLVTDWAWGADAHDIVTIEDGRIAVPTTWRSCSSTPTGPSTSADSSSTRRPAASTTSTCSRCSAPARRSRRDPTATGRRSSG